MENVGGLVFSLWMVALVWLALLRKPRPEYSDGECGIDMPIELTLVAGAELL